MAAGLPRFDDGLVAVLLPAWFLALGYGTAEIGAVSTIALLGSALMKLGVGLVMTCNAASGASGFKLDDGSSKDEETPRPASLAPAVQISSTGHFGKTRQDHTVRHGHIDEMHRATDAALFRHSAFEVADHARPLF